jgi:predicted phosphodiesterase
VILDKPDTLKPMKLAVLADTHGNFVALQEVAAHIEAWQPDLVVVAGDVVNRGPRSLDCLRFVQAKERSAGWLVVRGNHEDYIIDIAKAEKSPTEQQFEFFRPIYWTFHQLADHIPDLEAMPFSLTLTAPDGGEIRITHASMRSTRHGIFPRTSDDLLRELIAPPAPLICVGHTHIPLIRRINGTLVVNVGSAGLSFDGDPRISYAQLCWRQDTWQVEIVRLEYDLQQAEQDFYTTDFVKEGGPLVRVMLDELKYARSLLYTWAERYKTAVLTGKITVAEAVDCFLG